jgi:hypothetical protein
MPNPYPAEVTTSGVERLAGSITFTDPANQPGGGGGGSAVEGDYSGNTVTVTNGAFTRLTWDALSGGTELLDRSTADSPTFLADGTYAVTVELGGDALTVAGYAVAQMGAGACVASAYTQDPTQGWSVSGVFIAQQGDGLYVAVMNNDGASSRDFSIGFGVVVKL